ncbi:hypothetical protein [Burkholderia sp. BE17]|nr:hypothetical protein [Burkholderia sp. BE17]
MVRDAANIDAKVTFLGNGMTLNATAVAPGALRIEDICPTG